MVITDASSGLGESTARLLAGSGAQVVLGARRKDRIEAIVKETIAEDGSAIGFKADVTKRGEVEALVKGAMDKYGRIDVIVNNAGIAPLAPMVALKVEEWDRMIDVNIKGLLYGVAAALPIMQKQKHGHIINIASVVGFNVFAPGGTVYSATKFAVRAVTEALRMELKADNLRTTMISPGAVATELAEGSSDEAARENSEFYKIAIPADSIARTIAYAIEVPAATTTTTRKEAALNQLNAVQSDTAADTAASAIRPFRVNVPQEALVDPRRRIAATRWPDQETVNDQSQGIQLAKIKPLVEYWGPATTGERRKRS